MVERVLAAEIGGRIKQLRGGRSQRQFASQLGLAHVMLNRYENGVNCPNLVPLIAIAEHESVSLDWLVRGRGKPRG